MPGSEITVNRKPTKVLFLREVQTVFGENDNQKVFETENQQNELKVPFLAVILVPANSNLKMDRSRSLLGVRSSERY